MQARGQAVEALWRAAAPAGSLLRVSMHAGVPPRVSSVFPAHGPQHHEAAKGNESPHAPGDSLVTQKKRACGETHASP